MDLSKFSTEDLVAMRTGKLSGVSDEGLQNLKSQMTADAAPGTIAAKPLEADLYGDPNAGLFDVTEGKNRTSASFGNLEGIKPMLEKNGWKNIQQNPDGDIVALGPDGKYYKDKASFFSHPINWVESHAGKALPLGGMMLGGTGSGVLAAPESLGTATLPAAVAGAGFGGAVGEGARIAVGKKLGTYQGTDSQVAGDVGGEGVKSSVAELGGKLIGKIPIPFTGMNVDAATAAALAKLAQKGSGAATRLSQALTGVDKDAYTRMLNRPDEVAGALAPGNALKVAGQGADELAARAGTEGELISNARKKFAEVHGATPVNTEPMIASTDDALARNAPNSSGESGMTPAEIEELNNVKNKSLVTKTPNPGMYGEGEPTITPSKPAGELQRTADWMQEQVSPRAYNSSAPSRSGKSSGAYQKLLGQIKDAFHQMDPEGLGKADARFSDYANKAKILSGIEGDSTGESFANNLFGANKGAKQEAAQALLPKTYESMADIGAAKAMKIDPVTKAGLPGSAPAIIRAGGAATTALAGYAAGGTEGGLLGLGLGITTGVATSPLAHKEFYYLAGKYGMPAVRALVANPQIAPAILDSADLSRLRSVGQNLWSTMKKSGGK